MNERIKELADKASEEFTTYFDGRGNVTETYFDKEKFAQLIVRECCKEITQEPFNAGAASLWLKEYFGVEE